MNAHEKTGTASLNLIELSERTGNKKFEEFADFLADNLSVAMIPDEYLVELVKTKTPQSVYERLPQKMIDLILSGQPIKLSAPKNLFCVSIQ